MFSSTRISRRPRASVLCAVGALLIVGAAGAANSDSLTDPAGDAGTALDITSINASSDDAGTLTFAVNVAPGHTLGLPGDEIEQRPVRALADVSPGVARATMRNAQASQRLFDRFPRPAASHFVGSIEVPELCRLAGDLLEAELIKRRQSHAQAGTGAE